MRNPFADNRARKLEVTTLKTFLFGTALVIFSPITLDAQTMSKGSPKTVNPTSPTQLPTLPNFLRNPDGWAITGISSSTLTKGKEETTPLDCEDMQVINDRPKPNWWSKWSLALSTLYQFSNQRSRVGGLSWDSNSAAIDLEASFDDVPYTSLDLSYAYSHLSGTSPVGANDVTNQHIGAIRVLQPLDNLWFRNWKPADESFCPVNHQLAILVRAAYGGSPGSLASPNFAFQHDTAYTFVADTLLDYQLAWFPWRTVPRENPHIDKFLTDREENCYYYPNLVLELSTGTQFNSTEVDSSSSVFSSTTSGRQFDYLNSIILTGSLPCRIGLLVGATWDAPFDSQPLRGAKPYHSNTVTFTGGLVYNLYPLTYPRIPALGLRRWSMSLLYSYTAFDPLSETNTLQLQISYSF